MSTKTVVTDIKQVTVRFSGDSGDGMQLSGTLFSTLSAIFGNEISTFPDFPAEIRAPQGSLQGVSGFQVRIGEKDVYNSGDKADVLVAMNPAALKVNAQHLKRGSIVIYDTDSFEEKDLEKANYQNPRAIQRTGTGAGASNRGGHHLAHESLPGGFGDGGQGYPAEQEHVRPGTRLLAL